MMARVEINLTELKRDDFVDRDKSENHIIATALEAAGHAILKLDEIRERRFLRFCQTGKFD
ncbi:MAG: hypothetical protein WAW36_19095 [Methylovulum miyakonense]|uniref:hypothetical protein n=1 Tax=Methylovulum miyakonense TaxID=645578 RepID=UPI003BB4F724